MTNVHQNFLDETVEHWKHFAPVIHQPQNIDDYDRLSAILDELLDRVEGNEDHELMGLVDIISLFIERYDEEHYQDLSETSGINALRFLMQQHGLKQSDLNEIGSQGVVSEVLNGKRQLNVAQIKNLARRFNVSTATFID